MSLQAAARAADSVAAVAPAAERIRLRASSDDTVSLAIDVARMHDIASLAMAHALDVAVAHPRGRKRHTAAPSSARRIAAESWAQAGIATSGALNDRATAALAQLPGSGASTELLRALTQASVEFVVVGALAAAVHGAMLPIACLDILIEGAEGRTNAWPVLEAAGATLRAVRTRPGFRFDPSVVDSVSSVPVMIRDLAVTIWRVVPGLGNLTLVRPLSDPVAVGDFSFRVARLDALCRSDVPPDVARLASGRERWALLPALRDALERARQ